MSGQFNGAQKKLQEKLNQNIPYTFKEKEHSPANNFKTKHNKNYMFGFKVICWALLFIFKLTFPPGVST
jgi:hypothetical protein